MYSTKTLGFKINVFKGIADYTINLRVMGKCKATP